MFFANNMYSLFLLGREDAVALARLEATCFTLPWSFEQYEKILPAKRRLLIGAFEKKPEEKWIIPFQREFTGLTPVFGLLSPEHELLAFVSMGLYYGAAELEVYNIAVLPERRRQKLARFLLGVLLEAAALHGFEKALLEVRQGNISAIALYASLGFKTVGHRKGYYTDNDEDAWVLACSLDRINPET